MFSDPQNVEKLGELVDSAAESNLTDENRHSRQADARFSVLMLKEATTLITELYPLIERRRQ